MLPADTKRRFGRDPDALDARESSLESRAKRYAKSLGYWVRKFKSPGKRAAPDDVFANLFGFVFFIEFKARGKAPTPAQLAEHTEMQAHGVTVYVVDNYEDAKAILDRHCLS